jgi:hypothetical protein
MAPGRTGRVNAVASIDAEPFATDGPKPPPCKEYTQCNCSK